MPKYVISGLLALGLLSGCSKYSVPLKLPPITISNDHLKKVMFDRMNTMATTEPADTIEAGCNQSFARHVLNYDASISTGTMTIESFPDQFKLGTVAGLEYSNSSDCKEVNMEEWLHKYALYDGTYLDFRRVEISDLTGLRTSCSSKLLDSGDVELHDFQAIITDNTLALPQTPAMEIGNYYFQAGSDFKIDNVDKVRGGTDILFELNGFHQFYTGSIGVHSESYRLRSALKYFGRPLTTLIIDTEELTLPKDASGEYLTLPSGTLTLEITGRLSAPPDLSLMFACI